MLESVTVTEAKSYTKGNVHYDLNLQHYSNVEHLGEFSKIKELKPKTINFEDIPDKKGFISKRIVSKFKISIRNFYNTLYKCILLIRLIEIHGYLRSLFTQKSKQSEYEFFGVITDGKYKLDVYLTKTDKEDVNIERGSKLEIVGDIQEKSKYIIVSL